MGGVDNIEHRHEASGARVLRHAMLGDRRDTLPGDAAVENNINLTSCHSRAGGNPFGLSGRDGTMDSRLRGNDSDDLW